VTAEGSVRLRGHFAGLDGVRGLAILMVLAIHFVGDATPATLAQRVVVKAATFGLLGVDLFFVLSGFLITGLLLEAKGEPHYFRNFYARRILRTFPLCYAVLATLFLVLPLLVTLPPLLERARSHQIWLWTYTTNFFIAARGSWDSLTYVNHFWSLAIEEHFYLLWPLVVFTFRSRTLERICLGVLAGGLALRIGLALSGVSELSISVLTPCRIDTLCTGGLLALLVRRPAGPSPWIGRSGRAGLGLGLALLGLSAWCTITKLGLPVLHQVRNSGYAMFFGALTLLSLGPSSQLASRFFQTGWLRFFGKYSYGLYIYHAILSWFFLERGLDGRLDALLGNHALAMAARAVLGIGISTGVAVISYELFEKRFLALKRHFERPRARLAGVNGGALPEPVSLQLTPRREPPR
jgi:peptidoglycan/LPS O-acetylase OafA/YrhL